MELKDPPKETKSNNLRVYFLFSELGYPCASFSHGNPSYPPQSYPPRNKALLRVINHWFPLIRPY